MNEACDRCQGTAHYRVVSPHGAVLTFCGSCATVVWQELHDRGWVISPLTLVSTAPQAA